MDLIAGSLRPAGNCGMANCGIGGTPGGRKGGIGGNRIMFMMAGSAGCG